MVRDRMLAHPHPPPRAPSPAPAALLLVPLAGQAAAMTCGGKKVTIMGTAGNDNIVGKRPAT